MSLEGVMDAIAVRLATDLAADSSTGTRGLKGAFSAGSTSLGAAIIPRTTDDWPIAIVWAAGGDLTPGNGPEPILHRIEVQFWCNAAEAAFAYQTLIPFVERCRVMYRTDMDAATQAARVQMTGYSSPEAEDGADGKPFLVLTVFLEALEVTATSAYGV